MRHDSIKYLLQQELTNGGFITEIEKNAGSEDKSYPGDVKVLNWEKKKTFMLTVRSLTQ